MGERLGTIKDLERAFKDPEYQRRPSKEIEDEDPECPQKIKLMKQYLFPVDHCCLHVRRTLDQFYYSTLPEVDARTEEQAVFRFAETQRKKLEAHKQIPNLEDAWLNWIQNELSKPDGKKAKKTQKEKHGFPCNPFKGFRDRCLGAQGDQHDLEKGPQNTNAPSKSTNLDYSKMVLEKPRAVSSHRKKSGDQKTQKELEVWREPKVLMVNQLWMWVIDGGKCFSSIPSRLCILMRS